MRNGKLKVLFAASECSPMAKVGGLGDVIGSLPKALRNLGLDIRVVLPKYSVIDDQKYPSRLIASGLKVKGERVDIFETKIPKSQVILYLLANKKFFSENHIYFEKSAFVGSFKEIERFLFFSKAVLEIFPAIGWFPEIIHCHDWPAAIIPDLVKIKKLKIKTLLTIHNLANQAKWGPREILDFLEFKGNEIKSLEFRDKNGDFNVFQQGILESDMINTVSPTYSKQILTKEYGYGLEEPLSKRKKDLFGILNGIDTEFFNPATDSYIKSNYSADNFEKKTENKINLQESLNLSVGKSIPLFGIISRLTFQKGIDLVVEIIPELVKASCQLVVLGVGEEKLEKKLLDFQAKYPKNISVHIKFDAALAQKIYSGSDVFLMPSLFEPCGLGQIIAMRYGTIPIVRDTGGLSDTVKNKETGFVFKEYKSESLLEAINSALEYFENGDSWKRLVKKAMIQDFSWQKSAGEYLKLYNRLLK